MSLFQRNIFGRTALTPIQFNIRALFHAFLTNGATQLVLELDSDSHAVIPSLRTDGAEVKRFDSFPGTLFGAFVQEYLAQMGSPPLLPGNKLSGGTLPFETEDGTEQVFIAESDDLAKKIVFSRE